MKITDLKSAIIGTNIVLRVMTDKGIDGYAEVESNKDFLQPLMPYFKSLILGCDPTDVALSLIHIFACALSSPEIDLRK